MIFYYGADRQIKEPEFNKGNPSNDYGLGFYLTKDKEIAKLWASQYESGGYLIKYDVDVDKLNVLELATINEEDVLKWITLLVKHRFSKEDRNRNAININWLIDNYSIDVDQYDAIIGYRADDSYFMYSREFVEGNLSIELLTDAMRIGKLGKQFVLKSEKAFKHIKTISIEYVPYSDNYKDFRTKTNIEYRKLKKEEDINNTFIRDIMRGHNK